MPARGDGSVELQGTDYTTPHSVYDVEKSNRKEKKKHFLTIGWGNTARRFLALFYTCDS